MRFTQEEFLVFEAKIKDFGYIKYIQDYKSGDFAYWKSFERDENRDNGYSVGLVFYDWSKHPQCEILSPISCSLEFMLGNNDKVGRFDLSISDDNITVEQFEVFCKKLFEFYKQNNIN